MSFPNVADAFWNWTTPVLFRVVTKTAVDYEVVETESGQIEFEGVLQPMPPQKLLVKPEGQRTWKWWYLWATETLATDAIVVDPEDKEYRVMSVSDWRNGGHLQYEVVQDPPLGQ